MKLSPIFTIFSILVNNYIVHMLHDFGCHGNHFGTIGGTSPKPPTFILHPTYHKSLIQFLKSSSQHCLFITKFIQTAFTAIYRQYSVSKAVNLGLTWISWPFNR